MRAALPLMFDVADSCHGAGLARVACIVRRITIATCVIATLLLAFATEHAYAGQLVVSTIEVRSSTSFSSKRQYAGKVVASRQSSLGFKRGGEIASVFVDLGDVVNAGDLLAQLDDRAIEAQLLEARARTALAEANVAAASAEWQLAHNTEQRFLKLREDGHVAQQIYDEAALKLEGQLARLEVARANLASAEAFERGAEVALIEASIVAPFAGVVQARNVDEGAQVGPGQAVLRLVESGWREAHVGVPNKVAADLEDRNGVMKLSWDGLSIDAHLRAVLPELDPVTRTRTAVLTVVDRRLPLGAVVELEVERDVEETGFWLPIGSLTVADRGLWAVYVVNDDRVIERRLVDVLHTEADRVFARGTLADRERIVSTGVQRVVPGQLVDPIGVLARAN